MDPDSPTARVERTFWTVWGYISGAVSRFLRPAPTNIASNDPNSIQESAVDSEPANVGHTEGDASRRGVDEEQPVAAASLLSSSRPLVAWDVCTTDIDLGPDEEGMRYKTQPSRGSESKASEEGEGTREEQFAQAGRDAAAGLLVAKEDKQEENGDQILRTGGQDETPEIAVCEEHAKARSLRLTGKAMSEDVEESGREAGAEEETERATTPEDPQKMGETIQVKEADGRMKHEDDEDLQAEDTEVNLGPITYLSLEEEEDNMHIEEAKLQRNKEDTAVTDEEVENSDGVPQLTTENENKFDEAAKQVENQLSVGEELSDDDRDVKEDPGFTSLRVELQTASDKSGIMSEDERIVVEQEHAMAQRSESDEVEDAREEEDEREQGAVLEEENVSEAANNQTRDEAPEQEDDIETVTEHSQGEEILTVTCSEEVVQNAKTDKREEKREENGDQILSTGGQDETLEIAVCEEHANARSLRLTGEAMSVDVEESAKEAGAEEETERATTPEDPQKMGETIQVKEADDRMQHEDEEDLQAEHIQVKLCPITDSRQEEEEDNMQIEEAKVQRNEADTAVTDEEVENSDDVPQLTSENENKSDETAKQVENQLSVGEELSYDYRDFKEDPGFTSLHVELQTASDKSGIMSEDERIVVEQEHAMAQRSESDEVEDAREEEDERKQGAVLEEENVSEAANNQTRDEAPEQEDNIRTVTEDSQGEDILTITCSEEVVQNAKTELHTAEFADGEQEGVAEDTDVQTKTRETAESHGTVIDEKSVVTTTHISVDERFFDQVEEERLCSEVDNKGSYMETVFTTTSVTVKPEGETGREMSGGFKNIHMGIFEGRVVVSQELNFPTCEETQEGVPEYNNEPVPDETDYKITTQRFLEDCEEIQGSPLPEEEESKEPESLQNSGTRADYLLVREHMEEVEEEQEGTQDFKNSFDALSAQETDKPLVVESGHLFEDEEAELLVDSMKTGIEHSEEELESDVELTDETDKLAKEPRDGTEELLVDFEIDKGLCDAAGDGSETTGAVTAEKKVRVADETFLESEVQKMTETSFFQESVDAMISEQNSNTAPGLLEDFTESGFLKQSDETGPELLEDAEMQDAGIDMEEAAEAAEDEMQNKNEMEVLHLAEPELSGPVESLETEYQRSDEALEMSNEEMLTDTEATDESKTAKPKDRTSISTEEVTQHVTESEGSYAEETVRSVSGRQEVIDDEILDLWLQTALSEDGIKQQEGPEPGQQMEPTNEEQDEESSVQMETDKEQLVELNSRELVSDTEASSSTVESGFSDKSLSEWGTQNTDTQLLKSTSTGSFHGIYDIPANISDISELSRQQPNSESQDILMEKAAEAGQSRLKEEESITGVTSQEAGHLNQEEEVESKEPESLQNSGTRADYLLMREHMEEEQEGTQDIKNSFDALLPQETEKPLVVESGHLFEDEEGELLVDSMKTGIEHSEEEFESDVELTDKTDKLAKEPRDGIEELLVDFEIDEGLCGDAPGDSSETTGAVTEEEEVRVADETFLEAEVQKMTETSFFQESVDAINSEQNSNTAPGLLEDITESGFLKQSDETGPELLEDAEMQDAEIDMEEAAEAAEDEMQNKNEMEVLHLAEPESSGPVESLETKYQRSDEALEMSNEEMLTDTEATLLPQETDKPLVVESGHLFEDEEAELLVDSMKTGIKHSEEEFESDVELTDKTDKLAKEPRDGTEELLVDFEIDEGLCDAAGDGSETTGAVTAEKEVRVADETFLEAEVQKMTEKSFFQESIDAINSEQNSNTAPGLLEDLTESGFLKQSDETGPELLEDAEMQDAGIDMEEAAEAAEELTDVELTDKTNKLAKEPGDGTEELLVNFEIDEGLYDAAGDGSETTGAVTEEVRVADETFLEAEVQKMTETSFFQESVDAMNSEQNSNTAPGLLEDITESGFLKQSDETGPELLEDAEMQDAEIDMEEAAEAAEDEMQNKNEMEVLHLAEPESSGPVESLETKYQRSDEALEMSNEEMLTDTEATLLPQETDKPLVVESGHLFEDEEGELLVDSMKTAIEHSEEEFESDVELTDKTDKLAKEPRDGTEELLVNFEIDKGLYDAAGDSSEMTGAVTEEEEVRVADETFLEESDKSREETDKERVESVETETVSQKEIDAEVPDWKDAEEADAKSLTGMSVPLRVEKPNAEDEPLEITVSDPPDEIKHTESRSGLEASLEEEMVLRESGSQGDTCTESERKSPSVDKPQPGWSEDVADSLPGLDEDGEAEQPTTTSEDQMEVDTSALDFTAQRSRIAVKDPRVRPPKDPRSLLNMPSLEPTPRLSAKVPAGVPLGGLGIGIKLPGFGAGFPVLKKTRKVVREENSPDALSQETKPEEKSDTPKQDEAPHRPKWMPPKHPGFGNPLMSELKNKLKKTTKE